MVLVFRVSVCDTMYRIDIFKKDFNQFVSVYITCVPVWVSWGGGAQEGF